MAGFTLARGGVCLLLVLSVWSAAARAEEPTPQPLEAPPLQVPTAEVLPSTPSSEPPPAVIDVEVRGARVDAGKRLASSSAAVLVVETREAQREASDLGAVLARTQGVNVQRSGGLGAQTRVSLQGLGEDQIRFYVDGVPLGFTGLPESIAYVPVDLVSRVELYRGVVPIRFGGDTLGGAIHLVSHAPEAGTHGSGSVTLGAFDTARLALRAQSLDPRTGLYASASAFMDHARNDYPMDGVLVAQRDGRRAAARVYRQHDAYQAGYGQLEVGVVDRPYAKRLSVRAFASGYDKEINHDLLMYNPYGEVTSRRRAQGALLFYEHKPRRNVSIDLRAGYAHRTRQLRDLGKCAYDWYGNCLAMLPNGGEIFGLPADRRTDEDDVFLRMQVGVRVSDLLQFRASIAPTYAHSNARDAAVGAGIADLFAQQRDLFGLTLGLEHELDAFEGRLENVLFVKDYLQRLSADATTARGSVTTDKTQHRFGVGNAARLRLLDTLSAKLSYELGARLPDGNEIFGDGGFVEANLRLRPETSHNLNVELLGTYEHARVGLLSLTATAFFRQVKDFIFLLPGPMVAQYLNLADARVLGAEGAAHYTMPGEYVRVDGSITVQDMRNQATRGPFAMFEGERIPNRPFLFANLSVTGKLQKLLAEDDALSLTFRESYVAKFYRAFEVQQAEQRGSVPTQLVSSAVLTYEVSARGRGLSASLEANNLTNARVYDFFGVQRPGRYALAKLMFRL